MVYFTQLITTLWEGAKGFLSELNWVDIVILTLLLRTGYIGIRKGLFIEIMKSAGLGAGFIVSTTQHVRIGNEISQRLNLDQTLSQGLAFFGVLFITYVAVRLFGLGLRKLFKIEAHGFWDCFWGAWAGLVRGTAVATCLLTGGLLLGSGYLAESIENRSLLAPWLVKGGSAVYTSLHHFSASFALEGLDHVISTKQSTPKTSQ